MGANEAAERELRDWLQRLHVDNARHRLQRDVLVVDGDRRRERAHHRRHAWRPDPGRVDDVDTCDVGQSGRDPFCERRITHIDR